MVGSGPTTASRAGGEGKEDPACFPGSGRGKRWRRKEKEGRRYRSEREAIIVFLDRPLSTNGWIRDLGDRPCLFFLWNRKFCSVGIVAKL